MSEEQTETEQTTEPQAEPQADPHAFTPEQQELINGLLAKERALATRKARQAKTSQQTKQEPTTSAGDHPQIDAMAKQLETLTSIVQASQEKALANENATAFATDTAGLTISDTDKQVLRVLQQNSPDVYAAKISEYRSADQPPAAKGPGYKGTSAPVPESRGPDLSSLTSWTSDDIQAMKTAGTFRENLDKARNAMPGGSGGFFKAKK